MSLGPPFDRSGERVQLCIGAAAVVVLISAVAVALLTSDRSLGDTITLHILIRNPGALHTGGQVHMAGYQIGEIVAIRGTRMMRRAGDRSEPPTQTESLNRDMQRVEIEARILRSWQRYIYRNSTFFASTPNVLTEAVLEVGPPPATAELAPPVQDGEQVHGADPPEIDRLLQKVHANLGAILQLARELRPEWEEFTRATGGLLRTVDGLSDTGQVARIALQGDRAITLGRSLYRTLDRAEAVPRVQTLAADLFRSLDEVEPSLRRIARQLGVVQDRLTGVTEAVGPRQRRQLLAGVDLFRKVLSDTDRISTDLLWLLSQVQRGRGTIGGFRNDIQIFDELKELHRLLKHESWRILLKGQDRGQRHLR